ncbi:hypothetical protein BST81_08165 [Leptolyngbya sp. 'hensonii']|uniref:DUF928 domain-containing protein n=1 Tax=Leptolyngbya sp. 'hensonii' TaxID=1922337 RepID=UPI00094F68B3|nr:DUF928 domain-containing protein [Leptolyngbya sp. 'hensonii']OLP18880.1 hypothetical protein BST81_08165 [Leptolyngbya sp. 'hensonii']
MSHLHGFKQIVVVPLCLGLISLAIVPGPGATKQPLQNASGPATSDLRFIPPVLSNTAEEPGGRSRGGGSRGDCARYINLTALAPSITLDQKEIVLGLTTTARPTFWFYVPSELTREAFVEFVLQDRNDNLIYETKFKAAKTPSGIISVRLPDTAATLEPNRSYQWTLSIYCNPAKPSESSFVQGLIRRVALKPELQGQIDKTSNPLERAKRYAQAGIWYDALTILGNSLQRQGNQDPKLAAAWANLLQQAGLADIARVPLVPCCRPQGDQRSGL